MKKFLLSLLFINVSFCNIWAQNEWERPDAAVGKQKETVKTVTRKEKVEDPKYMAGAVTENEGKVEWTCKINMPGKSSQHLYDLCLGYLQDFVKEEDQLPESNVTLVNKSQRVIVATLNEWLVFKSTFLSLDRAKLNYVLVANCTDGCVELTMRNIFFRYDENDGKGMTKILAEESINDKNALNKKKTKLVTGWAKFRRMTIDRKDEVFDKFRTYLADK